MENTVFLFCESLGFHKERKVTFDFSTHSINLLSITLTIPFINITDNTYHMLSFIVIGRNEGHNLLNCFKSIFESVSVQNLKEYEIIYVDSDSTDNSIEIASEYATKVISLSGDCNAAIGRNIGAAEAQGESLIFLDGDMEIQTNFFQIAVDSYGNLNFPYVSGDLVNVYFDSSNNLIGEGKSNLKEDKYMPYTGGFFCIQKKIWTSVGGMREKYRRSQDLDLGFRLSKKGIFVLRKKELAVKHNTISYFDKDRMKKIFLKNDFGYRSMLYRDHILNKNIYKMLLRTDYSFLLLFLVLLSLLFGRPFELTLLYLFVILTRALLQSKSDKNNRFQKMIFLITKDVQMLFSLFFFFPKRKKMFNIKIL